MTYGPNRHRSNRRANMESSPPVCLPGAELPAFATADLAGLAGRQNAIRQATELLLKLAIAHGFFGH
jgi:hypothetical protein